MNKFRKHLFDCLFIVLLANFLLISFIFAFGNSSECQDLFGGEFSNKTSDRLIQLNNYCIGRTDQGEQYPDTAWRIYKIERLEE